jgi:hypothetical protein
MRAAFPDGAGGADGQAMDYTSVEDFLSRGRALLAKGPVALIFAEDGCELASTIAHHRKLGFATILLFAPRHLDTEAEGVTRLGWDPAEAGAVARAVTAVAGAAPAATWVYWGYNAEYLFFPFCEARKAAEMLAFHAEERREAMLACVVDLYAPDLDRAPDAVNLEQAMFDRTGYYALARHARDGQPLERQVNIFGGLRWRFEEHVPWTRRRIDRVALFRTQKGLALRPDHTFSIEEYNTYACPWHHNLSAAVASFRTAKALRTNPGSRWAVSSFQWQNSVRFDWSSRQLMDLGLMEPGQWF